MTDAHTDYDAFEAYGISPTAPPARLSQRLARRPGRYPNQGQGQPHHARGGYAPTPSQRQDTHRNTDQDAGADLTEVIKASIANKAKLLEGLNDAQKLAVTTTDGPVMIVAGAGSGKTTVLTRRAGYLVENGVAPKDILCVTFTNKAAKELKERLVKLIGPAGEDITAGTFHSLILRFILRKASEADLEKFGLKAGFSILDTTDSSNILSEAIKADSVVEKTVREKEWKKKTLMQRIGLLRANGVTADEFYKQAVAGKDLFDRIVATAWREYMKICRSRNAIDFDDILLVAKQLLDTSGAARADIGGRWRYLMVDEFQDTNRVQMDIIRHTLGGHRNLCVVGDDKQSIYGFRGSEVQIILGFKSEFPDAQLIDMQTNYRSAPTVVAVANAAARAMPERVTEAEMTAHQSDGLTAQLPPPVVVMHKDDSAEADWVARQLALMAKEGVSLLETAVLYRNRTTKDKLEQALANHKLPYSIIGDSSLFERKEVRDAVSLVRLVFDRRDDMAVYRLIDTIKIGVSAKKIQTLVDTCKQPAFEILRELSLKQTKAGQKLNDLLTDLDGLNQVMSHTGENAAMYLKSVWESWLLEPTEKYNKQAETDLGERIKRVDDLFGRVERDLCAGATPEQIIEDIALQAGDADSEEFNGVNLMTIHASKGLEFKYVFMIAVEDEAFPGSDDESDINEERRAFYVAVTRAKRSLVISLASKRNCFGKIEPRKPSRFLRELGGAAKIVKV